MWNVFIVFFDVGGCVSCLHHNASYQDQTQTRACHLSACIQCRIINDIGLAQARNSIGPNVFYVRSGQIISKFQVKYLSGFHGQGQNHYFLDEEFIDADKLINLLKGQQHSHVVLYHQDSSNPNQELILKIKKKSQS